MLSINKLHYMHNRNHNHWQMQTNFQTQQNWICPSTATQQITRCKYPVITQMCAHQMICKQQTQADKQADKQASKQASECQHANAPRRRLECQAAHLTVANVTATSKPLIPGLEVRTSDLQRTIHLNHSHCHDCATVIAASSLAIPLIPTNRHQHLQQRELHTTMLSIIITALNQAITRTSKTIHRTGAHTHTQTHTHTHTLLPACMQTHINIKRASEHWRQDTCKTLRWVHTYKHAHAHLTRLATLGTTKRMQNTTFHCQQMQTTLGQRNNETQPCRNTSACKLFTHLAAS